MVSFSIQHSQIEHQCLLEGNKDGKWKVDLVLGMLGRAAFVSATLRCSWLGFFSCTKWTNSVIVISWALLQTRVAINLE